MADYINYKNITKTLADIDDLFFVIFYNSSFFFIKGRISSIETQLSIIEACVEFSRLIDPPLVSRGNLTDGGFFSYHNLSCQGDSDECKSAENWHPLYTVFKFWSKSSKNAKEIDKIIICQNIWKLCERTCVWFIFFLPLFCNFMIWRKGKLFRSRRTFYQEAFGVLHIS